MKLVNCSRKCLEFQQIDENHVANIKNLSQMTIDNGNLMSIKKSRVSLFRSSPSMWASMEHTNLQTKNNGCNSFHNQNIEYMILSNVSSN